MLSIVRQYRPSTWDGTSRDQIELASFSEEFVQLTYELRRAYSSMIQIQRVIRVQDLHSFGQFLIREQLLINSNYQQVYRVRRYITVNKTFVQNVIRYNLDPRRCGLGQTLTFKKNLTSVCSMDLIVVVKVLTTEPEKEQISPNSSCDYYVDYLITL